MKSKRILSLLLSFNIIFSAAPAYVLADNTGAEDARVYLTVSDRGTPAADNDGNIMANREVTVKDINLDGKLSYDEALKAAHKEYNSESGYVSSNTEYGVSISKLWGVDTGNTLFFKNNESIANDVGTETVADGDKLTASVNKDNTYYADWYTFFDNNEKTVEVGEKFTLTLKGHLGMAYTDEDKVNVPIQGVSICVLQDGEFVGINNCTTDKDGVAELSFDKSGVYYITADGTVKDSVTDWSNGGIQVEADCPIIAPVCVVTVKTGSLKTVTIQSKDVTIEDGRISVKKGDTFLLGAYDEDGKEVFVTWESQNTDIADIDENGSVKAKDIGSTVITAVDGEGAKGSVEIVVEQEEKPCFERLEFSKTALVSGSWTEGSTFSPTTLTYDLPIKNYSTSSLALQSSTTYDTEKYNAYAQYTDVFGQAQNIFVNSGKMTTLPNQPFDNSVMTITVADKNNEENKTVYTFNVSRPRDTQKALKSSGITLIPGGRDLSSVTYNGVKEGTMQYADESGTVISGTGVNGKQHYYRTFIYDNTDSFKLNLKASTDYAHIRYSTDGGNEWEETAQGGAISKTESLPKEGAAEVIIQIIDDAAYNENIKNGRDGFFETTPEEYKLWIDILSLNSPKILTAQASNGDWYPAFDSDMYSYCIIVDNGAEAPVITYTVSEGSTVKIGSEEQIPDADGKYTVTLSSSQKSINVTSSDGEFSAVYKFVYKAKSAFDVPDKVTDYLCMGSQYTNAAYGVNPEQTLAGNLKSLGNFGGYITYYYENPITDNPNNKYGMDFYAIGNSNEGNIDSMAELGQVYVSEDGNEWYALAGSEHYEDKAIWDYSITYTKGEDGKAYWTDNQGNNIDYAAKTWPSALNYPMNNTANKDTYTFTGVVFKSQMGNITGNSSSTASFAAKAKFGYADYYASNISSGVLQDVNSYVEKPSKANGFDVAWAVDDNGMPVDVSEKEFHYIKVATASNIWAGIFGEKSTEVTYVIRTTAQDNEVGKTDKPTGVTISDNSKSKTLNFTEDENIYSVNLDDMKYVSIKVNGTQEDDNIYINNQRVVSGSEASGFKVTKENGETLVRIIVQNGDKEPAIYMLKLTSNAEEKDTVIEDIKINADGSIRKAETKNGTNYSANVGYRINSVAINVVAKPQVTYTINGESVKQSYELDYGNNIFEISAEDSKGNTETVTLTVTRENAPVSDGKNIYVTFTLYGDDNHDSSKTHTYSQNKNELQPWIKEKSFTADKTATVLDILEKALNEAGINFINDGGNYISSINGLAEFDNGPLSGWMYLLNGKYPNLGVSEQTLKNGDKIIFHYTDDYTQEQGAQDIKPSSSGGGSVITQYTVSFETNSAQSIQSQKINKNEKVKEPDIMQREGYIFDGWYTDKEFEEKYDFDTKVTKNFTLYAKWTENKNDTGKGKFIDVAEGAWYENAVAYVTGKNLFKGVSETEFAPDKTMTRAMLLTVIWRMEKEPSANYVLTFNDTEQDKWYTEAIRWATAEGLAGGYDKNTFGINDPVTREQTAAILYRYAQYKGLDVSNKEDTDIMSYEDFEKISPYAVSSFEWAIGSGVIKGTDNDVLNPLGNTSRAQVAEMLMRFCENKN